MPNIFRRLWEAISPFSSGNFRAVCKTCHRNLTGWVTADEADAASGSHQDATGHAVDVEERM